MSDFHRSLEEDEISYKICEKGGNGLIYTAGSDADIPTFPRALLVIIGLGYTFLGVAIVADIFMVAIETVTSKLKTVTILDPDGRPRKMHVKVWNATVANLTLMALGSSAPEILLSVIELLGNNYYTGELGPATIVGSAAFNLFVIMAVCVVSIPAEESRKIGDLSVFAITSFFSVFAYIWLYIVLLITTPNIVTLPEALITFLFFPMLVALAFAADKNWLPHQPNTPPAREMVEIQNSNGVFVTKDRLLKVTKDIKKRFGQITGEMHVQLVLNELSEETVQKSRAYYRAQACAGATGGRRHLKTQKSSARLTGDLLGFAKPVEELNLRLEQPVGMALAFEGGPPKLKCTISELEPRAQSNAAVNGLKVGDEIQFLNGIGTKKMTIESVKRLLSQNLVFVSATRPDTDGVICEEEASLAKIQFNAAEYAFMENAGNAVITVAREGALHEMISVHYYTEDATAKAGVRYFAQTGVLTFRVGQTTAEILVPLIDDDIYQGLEYFNVVLWGPAAPRIFPVGVLDDPTGCLPMDISLGISPAGLDIMAGSGGGQTVMVSVPRGRPLNCFWTWDQVRHIGAAEEPSGATTPLQGGAADSRTTARTAVVHMTLEGAGKMRFRCASFSHAVALAQAIYTASENAREYDESEKILLHKEHRKTLGPQQGSFNKAKTSSALNSIDGKILSLTEGSHGVEGRHKSTALLGACSVCAVTMINDDDPGVFSFDLELVACNEEDKAAKIYVSRSGACCRSTCRYSTRDGNAFAGHDYVANEGVLVFEKNEISQVIEIGIIESSKYEKNEYFYVVLSDATDGASFNSRTVGGTSGAECKVTINEHEGIRNLMMGSVMKHAIINRDR
jgi:Ca2+/Na+ antiporter